MQNDIPGKKRLMMHKAKDIVGYSLGAEDGKIGKVEELYFDDKSWNVRYLVTDTGAWLTGRQVLISSCALGGIDASEKIIGTKLTMKQVENGPSPETDKPVSRHFKETRYRYCYYEWPRYWWGPFPCAWGMFYNPHVAQIQSWTSPEERNWDPGLWSSREVTGYSIRAEDGNFGRVDDFIIDDGAWTIRYLAVDTANWWPRKEVLISPKWIERISWDRRKVFVKLSRGIIKRSPEYEKEKPVTREYEYKLYRHYYREGCWAGEPLEKSYRG